MAIIIQKVQVLYSGGSFIIIKLAKPFSFNNLHSIHTILYIDLLLLCCRKAMMLIGLLREVKVAGLRWHALTMQRLRTDCQIRILLVTADRLYCRN